MADQAHPPANSSLTEGQDDRWVPAVAARTVAPPAGAEVRLFRSEVLEARQTQWLGTVMLAPRTSFRLFTLVGVIAAAAIVALLGFGEFTRTARVNGWLLPHDGVVRVQAPRPGIVGALEVKEGSQVHKGDRLLTLSDELQSTRLGATQAQITQRLSERRASLAEERLQQQRLLAQQDRALATRVAALRSEEEQVVREISLLRERIDIADRAVALHRKLYEEGFISDLKLQQVQSELLEQRGRLATAERSRLATARERMNVEAERADLPLKIGRDTAQLERSIAELEQERAEAEARREIVVVAPHDGTVTAIHAVAGAKADTGTPLLSIVPPDSRLEAHLYAPSRSIGFVRAGQQVQLRYQAFPYQRFGHYEGVVTAVSRAALSPADLPVQLSGLTGVTGAAAGAAADPLYRITVKLASQTVTAYGAQTPLQPGMTLEADVALERRRLFEWVLDPLYAVTGGRRG
ncbi:HlyD family secretion protein [Ramlibacter tataouinensis]|uniref:HlyD family secretion protein n=1 Tax=Ramlibacter tataouinensis TaxID=94132 RepID=UPI0009ECFE94|nr:HlyD family efflux transporter periplasmic adaptor subunit [Ramlibacter tataouinensis]